MKHGVSISNETLKSVFLSNINFFKRYRHKLFGLTGTLGQEIE